MPRTIRPPSASPARPGRAAPEPPAGFASSGTADAEEGPGEVAEVDGAADDPDGTDEVDPDAAEVALVAADPVAFRPLTAVPASADWRALPAVRLAVLVLLSRLPPVLAAGDAPPPAVPRLGVGVADLVAGARVAVSCGQMVEAAVPGGGVRPPSCQTHASVEPGLGSCVPGPWLA